MADLSSPAYHGDAHWTKECMCRKVIVEIDRIPVTLCKVTLSVFVEEFEVEDVEERLAATSQWTSARQQGWRSNSALKTPVRDGCTLEPEHSHTVLCLTSTFFANQN